MEKFWKTCPGERNVTVTLETPSMDVKSTSHYTHRCIAHYTKAFTWSYSSQSRASVSSWVWKWVNSASLRAIYSALWCCLNSRCGQLASDAMVKCDAVIVVTFLVGSSHVIRLPGQRELALTKFHTQFDWHDIIVRVAVIENESLRPDQSDLGILQLCLKTFALYYVEISKCLSLSHSYIFHCWFLKYLYIHIRPTAH